MKSNLVWWPFLSSTDLSADKSFYGYLDNFDIVEATHVTMMMDKA